MSLFDTLLASVTAALAGAPTQGTRLLRLTTPLGPEVLLAEQLDLTEAIGPQNIGPEASGSAPAGLHATVHALAADTHLELKQLIGQPVLVQLAQADASLRAWHGHVTQAALLGSDGGLARYRLQVEPWLAFLGQRQDSWAFQDQTVPDIVEEIFNDYAGQGTLAPAWRWDLADRSVYSRRSLCIQYQETDLAFVQRLLREEGLFCWWEHSAHPTNTSTDARLGAHTLVIADHNGAFKSDLGRVRYTQAGAGLATDSLKRWSRAARVATARIEQASPDYRSLSLRPVQQTGQGIAAGLEGLALIDVPGAYAYENPAQGERLALCQMQALDAQREQVQAQGTLRSAAPGAVLTLTDHPTHDGLDASRDRYVILSARHQARSNLRADLKAQVHSLLGAVVAEHLGAHGGHGAQGGQGGQASQGGQDLPNQTDTPVYQTHLRLQRHAVPVRVAGIDEAGRPDVRLSPRPSANGMNGVQTAVVVGSGPVHTDRDHRIKIQFHWQRGANASHRLGHSNGSNAPASEQSGTWVRVAQSVAGANWGANFIPRVGQEVLVGFVGGDIDRPVVIGSLYNGQGQSDAQANQAAGGAAGSTGNAPAWFPGSQAQGSLQAHQHPAVLAGHKSQELASSQGGTGGHNQLVFDDSPGAGRIELATTSAQTRLQLGHLLHQTDNRRLQPRGHGLDLGTQAWGAVRAGSGLLLSTHGRSGNATSHIDPREPQAQLQQSQQLLHTLAESAQQQKAQLTGEPDVIGAQQKDRAKQLPVEQGLWASQDSLKATEQRGDAGSGGSGGATIGGGTGTVAAWSRPDLVLASPAGIGLHTPAAHLISAGHTASVTAGQDIEHAAQAQHSTVAQGGLVLYTYGKADNPSKPNTETGIRLHAASGNVNTQSQSAATRLTADKSIDVVSTQAMVKITAPQHVLLTAAGAAIDIRGGNITLKGPGQVEFRAAMKELAGGMDATVPGIEMANATLNMKPQPLQVSLLDADEVTPGAEAVLMSDGRGVAKSLSVAGGAATVPDFKPGLAHFQQTHRRD